jgi:hypothetical protein
MDTTNETTFVLVVMNTTDETTFVFVVMDTTNETTFVLVVMDTTHDTTFVLVVMDTTHETTSVLVIKLSLISMKTTDIWTKRKREVNCCVHISTTSLICSLHNDNNNKVHA